MERQAWADLCTSETETQCNPRAPLVQNSQLLDIIMTIYSVTSTEAGGSRSLADKLKTARDHVRPRAQLQDPRLAQAQLRKKQTRSARSTGSETVHAASTYGKSNAGMFGLTELVTAQLALAVAIRVAVGYCIPRLLVQL